MNRLSKKTLSEMKFDSYLLNDAPERFLQIGEGNFLRAFVDYFIDIANEKCGFNSKVAVVQPISSGNAKAINEQDGLYTVYLRSIENGVPVSSKHVVSSISRAINPYSEYSAFMDCAKNPDLRFIVSNTTEAGIVYDDKCSLSDTPPSSFPAKLTSFLYERYKTFAGDKKKGFIILSCELIDDNGKELERCVHKYASQWQLGQDFVEWLSGSNYFCNTLVDRIVTGYPHAEAEKLSGENGYEDKLMVAGEGFALWVIEAPEAIRSEFPFEKAGLPVILTDDCLPFKKRKVRLLNGLQTTFAAMFYLYGSDIVRKCMEDETLLKFINETLYGEIIPALDLPRGDMLSFAESIFDRLSNPFIDHMLTDITLNTISKWRARVLPTLLEYQQKFNKIPKCLAFGFASNIVFYNGTELKETALISHRDGKEYLVRDNRDYLEFYYARREDLPEELVKSVCKNMEMWGMDLTEIPGFEELVLSYVKDIKQAGMKNALAKLI